MNKYILEKLQQNYYVFLYIGYIVAVYIPDFRIGVAATVFSIILILPLLKNVTQKQNIVVVCFVAWALLTICFSDFSNTAINLYIKKICDFIIPIAFYFCGKQNGKEGKTMKFYYSFVGAMLLCGVLGICWYVTLPNYYMDYMIRMGWTASSYLYSLDPRLCSFIGSIGVGVMANCALAIAINRFFECGKKYWLFVTGAMVIICVMSMQRSSYIILLLILVWSLFRYNNLRKWKLVAGIMPCVLLIVSYLFIKSDANIILLISDRVEQINITSMFGSRMTQWYYVIFEMGPKIICGDGLGQCSQGSLNPICDGAYFNLLGEVGIIGFLMFGIIIVRACWNYRTNRRIIPFMIVVAYLLNAIGSNGFLYMDEAPLFWYSVGLLQVNTDEMKCKKER